jgi:hypothetical protein
LGLAAEKGKHGQASSRKMTPDGKTGRIERERGRQAQKNASRSHRKGQLAAILDGRDSDESAVDTGSIETRLAGKSKGKIAFACRP